MNNFSINYDFNPSDTRAMDEFRKDSLKEQKMEAVKFREFRFSIPYNETTLIDIAELIEKKAKTFTDKTAVYASDEECDKAIDIVMEGLKTPKSKAVFERLKNK